MENKNTIIKVMTICEDAIDSPMLRDFLKENKKLELVYESHSGDDVLKKCRELALDIILYTPLYHDKDAIELLRILLSGCPSCQCIMITTPSSDVDWTKEALLAGCRYLIDTPVEATTVHAAILEAYQALEAYRKQQNVD